MRPLVAVALMAVSAHAQQSVPLPGGPPVDMDYLAYDSHSGRLFIPAGNTGKVDVLDTQTGRLRSIGGGPTGKAADRAGGPSPCSVGPGPAFVGKPAHSSLCPPRGGWP